MTKFMGLEYTTSKGAFIPRPETELLVEACLELVRHFAESRILDIGTGTGIIPISLTKSAKDCTIVALDKSSAALEIAQDNARAHGVFDRIEFLESDLYDALKGPLEPFSGRLSVKQNGSSLSYNHFDIIISNPPYIPTWEIATLAEHVKNEPMMALDGGEDGLVFYRKLIAGAPAFLKKGGYLIMEMGYGQSFHLKKMLKEAGFLDIEVKKDLSNIDRIIKARWTN